MEDSLLSSTELQENHRKTVFHSSPLRSLQAESVLVLKASNRQSQSYTDIPTDLHRYMPIDHRRIMTRECFGFSDLGDAGHTAAFQACRETPFG